MTILADAADWLASLVAAPQWGIVTFLAGVLALQIINLITLATLGDHPDSDWQPRVSVLVPARNEEGSIESCLRSLLVQQYPVYEVIALDDDSQDATGAVLAQLRREYPQLKVLTGEPLPVGWVGKNWACHQLALSAGGDLLLFTDADTLHHPTMLKAAVAAVRATGADMLTGMPHQRMLTWGERLTIPMLYWVLFALLPIPLAHRLRAPALSAAVGQFLLFRRAAYEQIGRHEAVHDSLVEDFALARNIKSSGLVWRLMDAGSHVSCRMYANLSQAVGGFSRGSTALFSSLWVCVLAWGWLTWVFLEPTAVLIYQLLNFGGRIPILQLQPILLAISLSVLSHALLVLRFRLSPATIVLYPLSIALFMVIVARGIRLRWTGRPIVWKGREVAWAAPITGNEMEPNVEAPC